MGKRYSFLDNESVYESFNRLRDAFLAAKDGNEVDEVISAVLTDDEKVKIGRRVQVANLIKSGMLYREIINLLKVGMTTVVEVEKSLANHPDGFELIFQRREKVDREFKDRAYQKVGGTKVVYKKTRYTGFKRRDVPR